ncbi:hypothetical protein ACVXG8_05100 [Escherichia coli]
MLEIGSLFDLQMVIRRTVDPIDHRRADPDGLYVFDAHPSAGTGLFRRRHCRHLRANLPAMLDYPEVVVRLTLWCIVVGLYPTLLMTLIGVLWFPVVPFRKCIRRLMIGLMMPLAT